MDKKELLKSYEWFYHVTTSMAYKDIIKQGLIPKTDRELESFISNPVGYVFLTCEKNLCRVYKALKDANEDRLVVLRISANYISTLKIDLDPTHEGINKLRALDEIDGLRKSIDFLGTLACRDIIKPDHIEFYESNC